MPESHNIVRISNAKHNVEKDINAFIAEATVFVIDDDDASLQSIRWLIESVGLRLKAFSSAREFLESYQLHESGCLILDVRMPGMSGLELQQKIKELSINLPIIFITGHGDMPMAVKAMKAGAFEFLVKPFNDQTLLDSINQAIELDARTREKYCKIQSIEKRIARLTEREKQIMNLVVEGKLNKVIAAELKISPKTVELHRGKIMEKMCAESIADLVRLVLTYREYEDKENKSDSLSITSSRKLL